jgi:leucyl aminopeptidase
MPLNIELTTGKISEARVDVIAAYATQGQLDKQPQLVALDAALDGALLEHAKHADFQGKNEQMLELATLGNLPARRLLLVGIGQKRELTQARVRNYAASAARAASSSNSATLALVAPDEPDVRALAEGVALGAYRFSKYLTGERRPKSELRKSHVYLPAKPTAADRKALEQGRAVAEAVCIARDAVNEPPNELTPEALAQLCRRVCKKHKLPIEVLDKKGIASAGMKLHYAVGQGSHNEPRFIHMTYAPGKRSKKKLAFVGKGLTFDSGGLCIKPAAGMGEMKSDMGGAAAVLGLMSAIAVLGPEVEVHGLIGAAENMPDGMAYRPGDIFGSLDGKTVEIINTDAEGRLVLADALAYARRLEPDLIVDAATLTGACVVALGKTHSGFFCADDEIAHQLESAAEQAGEGFWRMPLIEELGEQLKSDVADLKHTGERWGGSITAALFLREFVGKQPWIHCDIAGPVLADKARGVVPKGGTGHAVMTFIKLVESF